MKSSSQCRKKSAEVVIVTPAHSPDRPNNEITFIKFQVEWSPLELVLPKNLARSSSGNERVGLTQIKPALGACAVHVVDGFQHGGGFTPLPRHWEDSLREQKKLG